MTPDILEIISKIKGISADSRDIKTGYLFAALQGQKQDGRAYIDQALAQGAIYIVAPRGTELPKYTAAKLIESDEPRRDFARLAAAYYKVQPRTIVAVTGTNGKTSTVEFAHQIWDALEIISASIGTLGVQGRVMNLAGGMTTPDPVTLHKILADLAAKGAQHVAMEASSHGIDQYRLDGVALKAAAFTNLTHDHLDYHRSMDAYFDAKARLFRTLLPADAPSVFVTDDPYAARLADECASSGRPVIRIGRGAHDTYRIHNQKPLLHGQVLDVEVDGQTHTIELGLIGQFQALNVLTALALVRAVTPDISMARVIPHLAKLKGVAGRLEPVAGHPSGAAVYVDYAHTPDGLSNVLKAVRPHAQGKVVVVFGCGGDRDKTKRPVMGQIAHELADRIVVTDDNPRSENPADIRAAILTGASEAIEIGNRREAIKRALASLEAGDILVIAGKGHEQGQIMGTQVYPFDDRAVARDIMQEM